MYDLSDLTCVFLTALHMLHASTTSLVCTTFLLGEMAHFVSDHYVDVAKCDPDLS